MKYLYGVISTTNKEELIRLGSVAGIKTRQFMHSTFVTPSWLMSPALPFTDIRTLLLSSTKRGAWRSAVALGLPFTASPQMTCIILAVALLQALMVLMLLCAPFSRSQRTWRHNRIRDAFAYAARQFKLQVYTNGRKDVQSSYEFSFKTDEYGVPTSKRSDLVVTDERGISYVLDVTICDPTNSVCVNHKAGGKAGSMPGLQLLYNNHVKTYEKICDKHKLRFIGG